MYVVVSMGDGKYELTIDHEDETKLGQAASIAGFGTVEFIKQTVENKVTEILMKETPG